MKESKIFERHRQDYLARFANVDFESICEILGVESDGTRLKIPFHGKTYYASKKEILGEDGKEPDYMTFVVLSKYILLAPDRSHQDPTWVSFKEFKRASPFANVNYFKSDTEKVIAERFSGKLESLAETAEKTGGYDFANYPNYDFSARFDALPRISMLLCFNDRDDEFPAHCSVLFQKHSEFYLDLESLAMTGALLAKKLKQYSRPSPSERDYPAPTPRD